MALKPDTTRLLRAVAACAAGFGSIAFGAAWAAEPVVPLPPASGVSSNAPWRQISPGVFALGQVRLDKHARTASFPATVNQAAGLVEYLLVTSYGKIHESVLRTDIEPYHLQLALLLLGAQGAGTNAFPDAPTDPLPGDPVSIEVSWTSAGKPVRRRADEWITNTRTRAPMRPGNWVFNGSRILEGRFIAQMDGSIVAIIADEFAIINNPRAGREDDEIWLINTNSAPPLETPVEVRIKLER